MTFRNIAVCLSLLILVRIVLILTGTTIRKIGSGVEWLGEKIPGLTR